MGIGSTIASLASFGINNLASVAMMGRQNDMNVANWRMQAVESPSLMMEGYRRAGINPLLALGHSADSIAPVGNQQPAQMDLAGVVNQAKQLELQEESMKMDNKVKEAQVDNLNAETGLKEVQQQYQEMVNRVFPDKSKAERDKMSAEIAHLKQQSDSLQLDNNLKRELAQGNIKLRHMLGDGKVADAMYMLGSGNIAQGIRITLAGTGKMVKGVFSIPAMFKGIGSVEKIVEKVLQNSKGDVVGRTITHMLKG